MTTKHIRYSTEFKLEAIKMVEGQGRKIPEVASSLSIGKTTLDNWVYKYRKEQQGITTTEGTAITSEQREIQELRKQVKQLKMEGGILNEEENSEALLRPDARWRAVLEVHKLC